MRSIIDIDIMKSMDQAVTPKQPPSAAPRKGEEVYNWLRKQIILSSIKDGQPIVELEVASAMGCSQGTVREALLRLQEEGLIVRQGYRGSVVSPISPNEARAFLDLRAQLESQAVMYSVPNIRAEHIDKLSDIVREMERVAELGDEYSLFELDQQFHITLFQVANMPALVPVLIRCSLYNHRNKISLVNAPRTLQETASRHWAIVEALQTRDAAEVERVLRHHIQSVVGMDSTHAAGPTSEPLRMAPEQQAIFDRLQKEDAHLPVITTLGREQAHAQFAHVNARWNRIAEDDYRIERFTIPAPAQQGRNAQGHQGIGALRIEHIKNHNPACGTIFHVHGGGWTFGNNETHLGAMARLAELTQCTVIGVDYGLAPDAPFPAGLNDCTWAWRWLRMQSDNTAPWYVAGDSAGANLALAMMFDLRNLGEALPDAGLLFYGVYAANHTTPSHRSCGTGSFGLTSERMDWYRKQYLSGSRRDPEDPRVSPLRGDLSDLPPLFLNAAGLDPLHDDTTALVQRLALTNTPFEFHNYDGVIHGFMQMSSELPQALQAFNDAAAFLRARHQPR